MDSAPRLSLLQGLREPQSFGDLVHLWDALGTNTGTSIRVSTSRYRAHVHLMLHYGLATSVLTLGQTEPPRPPVQVQAQR